MPETYEFDAVIIGAGIVGLAVAYRLREKFNSILYSIDPDNNRYEKELQNIIHDLKYKSDELINTIFISSINYIVN